MTMLKRLLPVQISTLSDDEVEVVMSTGTRARDGHILVPQGALLDNYRANPVVLFQHDANIPVARASDIRVSGNDITAKITFAPRGVSAKADEVRGLVKSGVISAVSVGFDPIDGEPIDPRKPYGGKRYTEWELLETSFVSVPADTGAVVTARELERDQMTNGATTAQTEASEAATQTRETLAVVMTRGLYEVSDLACMLAAAGYLQSWLDFEAEMEGDGSDVPGRFKAVLQDLGQVLVDMTIEEVAEMFADDAGERQLRILRTAKTRAGKRISKATIESIEEAITHHEAGIDKLRSLCRDDDDSEMAHEPGATRETDPPYREVPAIEGVLTDPAALVAVIASEQLTVEQRASFVEHIRRLRLTGEVIQRRHAA